MQNKEKEAAEKGRWATAAAAGPGDVVRKANDTGCRITTFPFEINIPCHPLRVSSDGRPNSPEGGGMVC